MKDNPVNKRLKKNMDVDIMGGSPSHSELFPPMSNGMLVHAEYPKGVMFGDEFMNSPTTKGSFLVHEPKPSAPRRDRVRNRKAQSLKKSHPEGPSWTQEEKDLFDDLYKIYDRNFKAIAKEMKTKNPTQVMKYVNKLKQKSTPRRDHREKDRGAVIFLHRLDEEEDVDIDIDSDQSVDIEEGEEFLIVSDKSYSSDEDDDDSQEDDMDDDDSNPSYDEDVDVSGMYSFLLPHLLSSDDTNSTNLEPR